MNRSVIIFDFNHTLYDPGSARLVDGARTVLRELRARGFALYLLSHGGAARVRQIRGLGLEGAFEGIVVTNEKTPDDLRRIVERHPDAGVYVVGDRPGQEIRLGNQLGFTTIRFRRGAFAFETPRSAIEKADRTIRYLSELLDFIPMK